MIDSQTKEREEGESLPLDSGTPSSDLAAKRPFSTSICLKSESLLWTQALTLPGRYDSNLYTISELVNVRSMILKGKGGGYLRQHHRLQ